MHGMEQYLFSAFPPEFPHQIRIFTSTTHYIYTKQRQCSTSNEKK